MEDQNKNFVHDAAAFLRFALRADMPAGRILETLAHDIGGLDRGELCFSPRVSGYAEREKKERGAE